MRAQCFVVAIALVSCSSSPSIGPDAGPADMGTDSPLIEDRHIDHRNNDRQADRRISDASARPGWSPVGPLQTPSPYTFLHESVRLASGNVLLAGGAGGSTIHSTSEIFDPQSATWTLTGSLSMARWLHTLTLLPNGQVLAVGGQGGDFMTNPKLASCELYNPVKGSWAATADLVDKRAGHTATLLPSGKVLVVGGAAQDDSPMGSCVLYDPASGQWSSTGSLITARSYHAATLLADGKVLVSGGYTLDQPTASASSELYDPGSGKWSASGGMSTARSNHSLLTLKSGQVLAVGFYTKSCELYDPGSNKWSVTGPLSTAREGATATLLADGRVLVTGGEFYQGAVTQYLTSCELYDSQTGTWQPTAAMANGRSCHTATLLASGEVLVAAGSQVGKSCELYHP